MELSPKPVGTAYKKIVPSAELPNIKIRSVWGQRSLNLVYRESFWQKDQSEEKLRILAERERGAMESRKADDERRTREEQEGR